MRWIRCASVPRFRPEAGLDFKPASPFAFHSFAQRDTDPAATRSRRAISRTPIPCFKNSMREGAASPTIPPIRGVSFPTVSPRFIIYAKVNKFSLAINLLRDCVSVA
jgi:hypothetical protein